MSEQGFYPNEGEASQKRGSSLLRFGGNGSAPPAHGDQTVISREPPMQSIHVTHAELDGPFRIGDRVGTYELTEYIGGGGMGRVFKATDTLLDRVVAVKILLPEAANNEEAVLRFQNEARSAARLDHDSIAKVHFVGEAEGLPYLVFEYVDGMNLRDLVRQRGPLPLSDAIGIALQVADSLAHASEHGVVHRDIKPSNILLRDDGQVKLIDFGLARIVEVEDRDNDLTASGVTLGTFDYISPEQARDPRTVDIRSDIYSLGCTLFYMLTGRPPFPEGTVLQKLLQHQGDRPPNVREFRPELQEEITLLLDRLMAKDPGDRYQTPRELRDQIQLLAAQLGLRSLSLGVKTWTLPAPKKASFLTQHLPWIFSVTALVLIMLGLDFYWKQGTDIPIREESVPVFPKLPDQPPEHTVIKNIPNGSATENLLPQSNSFETEKSSDINRAASGMVPLPKSLNLIEGINPPINGLGDPFQNNGNEIPSENIPIKSSNFWGPSDGYGLESMDDPDAYGMSFLGGTARFSPDSSALENTLNRLNEADGGDQKARTSPNTPSSTSTRYGIITVGEPTDGSVSFTTLAAACRAAATDDIIELRYHGSHVEKPLVLSGKNLIFRAAKGYKPSVVFQPDRAEPGELHSRLPQNALVSLDGGSLTAISIDFRLNLENTESVDRWSVFEVKSGESIRLKRCRVSVKNPTKQKVEVFRVAAAPSDELADSGLIVSLTPIPPAKIVLTDSIVRGNATFLLVDDERSVNASWDNGLLAIDGAMLNVRGSGTIWNRNDSVNLSLKHVTACAALGICHLGDSQQSPPSIPVKYTCYDSVILVSEGHALVTQWLDETTPFSEARFSFEGDRNYYQGFKLFLVQKNWNSETDISKLDFTAWQNRWTSAYETCSLWEEYDIIEIPDASKPFYQRGPDDYMLSDNPENPILYVADDISNLGFLIERLPSFTLSTTATTTTTTP